MTARLQLRDWLLTLLERNQTPGLEWLDRKQNIFSISWRHGRKKGWRSETDSQLFKEWAIYKKRYIPGNDSKNAKLWKSRFRCALNALSDVKELKTMSKTHGEDARKIYQFLQKQPMVTVKRRRFPREKRMLDSNLKTYGADNMKCKKITDVSEEYCLNKIDSSQIPTYKEWQSRMEQTSVHDMYANYHYMNSEGCNYVFYQTSQELYKFSDLFSFSLDEDDIEENKTIEELLNPKCHV